MNSVQVVLGMTKVYLDDNKSSIANVQIQNDCYKVSTIYEGLSLSDDEFFIYLGEIGNESFDFQICKSKIKSMGFKNGAIVINLLNNDAFIITIETDPEALDKEYIINPTA